MKTLVKELKTVLKKNEGIEDILLFGSSVKGSLNPKDLDLAIVSTDEKKGQRAKKSIQEKYKHADIQIITIANYSKAIWITLIREGYSIKYAMYLHELYRIKPVVLYTYSLKTLTPSKKVMFERGLKTFKGIKRLSNRVILVPISMTDNFKDFLQHWDLDIETEEYGLLPLLRKEEYTF